MIIVSSDAIAAKQGAQEELYFDAARLCDRRGENSDNLINSQVLCHIARYITKKLTRLVFLWSDVLYRFFAEKLRE